MSDDKNQPGSISVGDISGKGIAVGHGAYAENRETTAAPSDDMQALAQLVQDLIAKLQTVPAAKAGDADTVKAMATTLEASAKANASKTMLQVQADGLKKAAETLRDVAPTVLLIATQIAAHIIKLGS